MSFFLSVGEERLVFLRGKTVEFCLTWCLIGYYTLPFLDPFLGLSFGVLPSLVKLIQLIRIFRDPDHKFLLVIDQLYQTSNQFSSSDVKNIYFLIVVDAVILQIYHIFHLILNAVKLIFVYFFICDEEVSQDFIVI